MTDEYRSWLIDGIAIQSSLRLNFLRLISGVIVILVSGACHSSNSTIESVSCRTLSMHPVLFIHGSGLSGSSWDSMIHSFRQLGYPQGYLQSVEMQPRSGDNIRAARTFIPAGVERLLKIQRLRLAQSDCPPLSNGRVDLVAHSMGAFSARWYARFVAPENVRTLVTLAGANHGTNALCGRRGRGDQQMCPAFDDTDDDSNAQSRLNGTRSVPLDETPFGAGDDSSNRQRIAPDDRRQIVYYSIRLDPDAWIDPPESAILDGAGGKRVGPIDSFPVIETSNGNYLFTGPTSHDELPSDDDLIRFVAQLLR